MNIGGNQMETMKAIALRQSCRAYTHEQVDDESIKTVLKAANAAPAGMKKYDTLRLTVIQNPFFLDDLDREGAEFFGNPDLHPLYGARTLILVSSNATAEGQPPIAYSNVGCIIENMSLAATELGLGSCYIAGAIAALKKNEELLSKLNLPVNFVPISGIILGKPSVPLQERELVLDRIETHYFK